MENGKPLLEKADNFLQLGLDFVVIILESLSGVVGIVEFDLEDVHALVNSECVDDVELVAYCTAVVKGFVVRVSRYRIMGPLALRFMCGALPSPYDDDHCYCCWRCREVCNEEPLSLKLSGNVQNAIT